MPSMNATEATVKVSFKDPLLLEAKEWGLSLARTPIWVHLMKHAPIEIAICAVSVMVPCFDLVRLHQLLLVAAVLQALAAQESVDVLEKVGLIGCLACPSTRESEDRMSQS
jgi:hypothetical protein